MFIRVSEEEARKNLHVLENPQEAMVKKRCLMSKACGDYRQQMALEKRKVPLGGNPFVLATDGFGKH